MLTIQFDKPACQNIRESLRKEWLETNGLGDYASSTIPCCNTRKYHGLLVANLANPEGRHVLLSTLEESLIAHEREFMISCRKHPGVYYPHGWEYLDEMNATPWPAFEFRFGEYRLTREILMPNKKKITLFRYTITGPSAKNKAEKFILAVKPLLAYRNFHELTRSNMNLQVKAFPCAKGFMVQPYNSMPRFYAQTNATHKFYPSPDWCLNVEYLVEQERGFPYQEDLFLPGCMEIEINVGKPVILAASTEELTSPLENLWRNEAGRRTKRGNAALSAMPGNSALMAHLSEAGEAFMITTPHDNPAILAGYHWFEAWGRDSMISLPGLTFCAGKNKEGLALLAAVGASAKNGLIPNWFHPDGVNHAYNSIDASLWYIWAVQQMQEWTQGNENFVRNTCWPVIKNIIDAFMSGAIPTVFTDSKGMLHAGSRDTQLTWMDATVDGQPVTPRYGCPVEINALWYNALAYADHLAGLYGESKRRNKELLERLREAFFERFWVKSENGYLADVWREDYVDTSLRPNQIFAVSLPYPVLAEEWQQSVVERVRSALITQFGLRTLSPDDPAFCRTYFGNARSRDSAYHQGTVWPWPLGAFGEAVLRTSWDMESAVDSLLTTISPLFAKHVYRAGLGSISEIFDATPPHYPGGCIAQAWSVAELLRLLRLLQRARPETFAAWESSLFTR
jgi:predicted glycogen debranching enzyme